MIGGTIDGSGKASEVWPSGMRWPSISTRVELEAEEPRLWMVGVIGIAGILPDAAAADAGDGGHGLQYLLHVDRAGILDRVAPDRDQIAADRRCAADARAGDDDVLVPDRHRRRVVSASCAAMLRGVASGVT